MHLLILNRKGPEFSGPFLFIQAKNYLAAAYRLETSSQLITLKKAAM